MTYVRMFFFALFIPCLMATECMEDNIQGGRSEKTGCGENESQACLCISGDSGYQLCDAEIGEWGECRCEPECVPAQEVCDGVDNDCDGNTDEEGAAGAPSWYADADGDGYGNSNDMWIACLAPDGYVENDEDMDDSCPGCWSDCASDCGGDLDAGDAG